jgi:hypothetical protein
MGFKKFEITVSDDLAFMRVIGDGMRPTLRAGKE